MNDTFNPKLSNANAINMGVVENSQAMGIDIATNALNKTREVVGNYAFNQARNEMEDVLLGTSVTENEEDEVVTNFRDEVDEVIAKSEQGIINNSQKINQVNMIASKYASISPEASNKIFAIRDKNLSNYSKSSSIKSKSATNNISISQQAALDQAKKREELSFSLFNQSSRTLTEKQSEVLENLESVQQQSVVNNILILGQKDYLESLKTQNNISDEQNKQYEFKLNKISNSINSNIYNRLDSELNVFNINVDTNGLTDSNYNDYINKLESSRTNVISSVSKDYAQLGKAVPKNVLDNINNRYNQQLKSFEIYKNQTLESKQRLTMDDISTIESIRNIQLKTGTEKQTSFLNVSRIYDSPLGKALTSSNQNIQIEAASKSFPELINKYTNDDGVFNGKKMLSEITTAQDITPVSSESLFGKLQNLTIQTGIAKQSLFGLDKSGTVLNKDTDNPDPQDSSINYLVEKQIGDVINLFNSGNFKDGMKYVMSNLKMHSSGIYQPGATNGEVSQSRLKSVENNALQNGIFVTQYLNQNPTDVFFEDGVLKTSNTEVNNAIIEINKTYSKFKNVNGGKESQERVYRKLTEEILDNAYLKPMENIIRKTISDNPKYSILTESQKDLVVDEILKKDLSYNQALNFKSKKANDAINFIDELTGVNNKTKSTSESIFQNVNAFAGSVSNLVSDNLNTIKSVDKLASGESIDVNDLTNISNKLTALSYFITTPKAYYDKISVEGTKIFDSLFGDSFEEKIDKEIKKTELTNTQINTIRSIKEGRFDAERSERLYNNIKDKYYDLELKRDSGDDLTDKEINMYTYYSKIINEIKNKNIINESVIDKDLENEEVQNNEI